MATYTFNEVVHPIPLITVTASAYTVCPGISTTLTASGSVGTSSYTWTPAITNHTSVQVAHPTSPTTYTVMGKNSFGCVNSATVSIDTYTAPATPLFDVPWLCDNRTSTVNIINVVSTDSYSWTASQAYNSPSFTCDPSAPNTPTCTGISVTSGLYANINGQGVYTVYETNGFGCVTTNSITLIGTAPVYITNTGSLTYCANNPHPIVLSASTGVGPQPNFVWSTATGTLQTAPTITVQPTTTTVYSVTSSYPNPYECDYTATITVTVNQPPTVTISASSQTICAGQSTTLTASGSAYNTYTWTASHPPAITTTFPYITVSPSVTTTYYAVGSGTVNNCNGSSSITITVNQPATPIFSSTLCAAQSNSIAVTNAVTGNTYTWSPSTNVTCGQPSCSNVVINNPPTGQIYTVTVSDGNGCTNKATITTKASPNVTVTPPNSTYCTSSSQAITLTGHNATTYTWSSNAGGVTTQSVTIPPLSSSDVFTVTGTNNNGCSASATATINVVTNPTVSISASANPICAGTNATLTASGATTYTWVGTAGSGINGTNHNSYTVTTASITSNATYTLNGTTNGCSNSSVLTLSVVPSPTFVVSYSVGTDNCATNTVICSGSSVQIFASSPTLTGYTVMPSGATGSVLSPAIVTPTSNTTYTVYGTDGNCVGTQTLSIPVTNCTAGLQHLPTSGNAASGHNYVVVASFTLTGNLTITSSTVNINPNVTITVPTNSVLTINSSHLLALTNTMWQGIVVKPGGTVNVLSNTMIEDAIVAIDNGGSATNINTGNPSKITAYGAIFNCNRTAIRLAYYQSTTPANYGLGNFNVQGSVITCRCGISQPAGVIPLMNYVGGTPASPTINDFYSVANYTSATLKYPYFGVPAYEGVHLEENGVFGSQTPQNSVTNVGGAKTLLIDNLTYGVNAINATFSVSATTFQMGHLAGTGFFNIPSVGGYGINAVNTKLDWYNGVYAANSQFIELVRGINTINYYDHVINKNTIFSTQVITPVSNVQSLTPPVGAYGMFIKSPRFKRLSTINNHIANINNCIDIVVDQNSTYNGGNGESVAAITVNTNTIVNQFPTTSYSTTFVGNGIVVDNVLVPTSTNTVTTPVAGIGTEISVRNNIISQAYRGILVRNQAFQITRDEGNKIDMQLEPTTFANPTTQYGIEHNRVAYLGTTVPGFATLTTNTVTGFITPSNYGNNNTYIQAKKGIWCNITIGQYVTCNTITNAGRAMEFSGNNTQTVWRLNQMNTSGYGMVLSVVTGGGIIGAQGAIGDGSDNTWSGFSASNPETYVDGGSNANNSPLYIQNLTGYVPLFNNNAIGGIPYIAFPSSNLLNSGSPSTTYNCSTVIVGFLSNTNQTNSTQSNARIVGGGGQNNSASSLTSMDSTGISLMEQIVQDSILYVIDSAQNSFINKDIVYHQLSADTSLMTNSAILQNFYATSQSTCRQLFAVVEDSLLRGNYSYASGLVNGFVPSCTIEQNYKRFYQIYMDVMQDTATVADSTDLETLAASCPLLNGLVVFQARAFHNSWYNDFKHYEDNCPQMDKTDARLENQQVATKNLTPSIFVYPNPNNGKFYVSGFDVNDKTANIEITDITGKLMYKQQNNISNGLIQLSLPFDDGVYFIRVINSKGAVQMQKIIISN